MYEKLDAVEEFVQTLEPGTIVLSGGASGVDKAAEQAWISLGGRVWSYRSKQLGKKTWGIEFWDIGGSTARIVPLDGEPTWADKRSACLYRDMLIAFECDELSAFWNGWSPGTKFTATFAKDIGREVTWKS